MENEKPKKQKNKKLSTSILLLFVTSHWAQLCLTAAADSVVFLPRPRVLFGSRDCLSLLGWSSLPGVATRADVDASGDVTAAPLSPV